MVDRIVNISRDRPLAERIILADTFWLRLRGLMGRPPLKQGEALLLIPCRAVHSFGLNAPIDVLHLHRERVCRLLNPLPPNRFGPLTGSDRVIELPAGTIDATGTREGDRILLSEDPAAERGENE